MPAAGCPIVPSRLSFPPTPCSPPPAITEFWITYATPDCAPDCVVTRITRQREKSIEYKVFIVSSPKSYLSNLRHADRCASVTPTNERFQCFYLGFLSFVNRI